MKTFYLFCQVFYGELPPEFTPGELLLLAGCEKPYTTADLCLAAEAPVKKVQHPEVTIITSCGTKG